eukprot:GCRY01001570.1.p1 GENE.GCRY01001570.1~~GCRY01001570.1.p1  ORF type:complete len:195 (-),score=25.22 GCRY01001570.1:551-1135(-)
MGYLVGCGLIEWQWWFHTAKVVLTLKRSCFCLLYLFSLKFAIISQRLWDGSKQSNSEKVGRQNEDASLRHRIESQLHVYRLSEFDTRVLCAVAVEMRMTLEEFRDYFGVRELVFATDRSFHACLYCRLLGLGGRSAALEQSPAPTPSSQSPPGAALPGGDCDCDCDCDFDCDFDCDYDDYDYDYDCDYDYDYDS